jgi:hypothetical protein
VSPKRDRTVRQIVEKYRRKYPELERPLIRKLIRLKHREIFKPLSSKLKTLDRELKRSFNLNPHTLLPIAIKLEKERMDILGTLEMFNFQDVLQSEFDLVFEDSKRKNQTLDMREIIEIAKRKTLKEYEAHKLIKQAIDKDKE